MVTLKGKLTSLEVTDFTRFGLTALYQRILVPPQPGDAGLLAPASVTGRPAANGTFAVDLGENNEVQGPFRLIVTSPAGNTVADRAIASDEIGRRLTIEVTPVPPFSLPEDRDPAEGVSARISGRALNTKGEAAATGLPVLLWGAAGQNETPRPLVATETSTGGYFSADWPSDRLVRAFATVSGLDAGPIALEDGRLPTRIVLVLDLPEPAPKEEADCACEAAPPRTPDQHLGYAVKLMGDI